MLLVFFYALYLFVTVFNELFLLKSHNKDALQDGLQDDHLELDSPESDGRDSMMESRESSCDSRCSKSAMCSVS